MNEPLATHDRVAALLAELEADRRPAQALRTRLQLMVDEGNEASASVAAAVLESLWYTMPPFADEVLPEVASVFYERLGLADAAMLMAGLAVQLQQPHSFAAAPFCLLQALFLRTGRPDDADDVARRGGLPPLSAGSPPEANAAATAAQAAAIAAAPSPAAALLHALELLGGQADWRQSALLFESVWHRVRPLEEYWIYHRMAQVYAALDRKLAAMLMAGMAVQIEPANPVSDAPYRLVLDWFRAERRTRDAASLCRRRARLCPSPALLSDPDLAELFAAAGPLPPVRPAAGRRDIALLAAEVRPAQSWPCYGEAPTSLRDLSGDMHREGLQITELRDAEVLLDGGAVAVHGPDGLPHIDLSLRDYPALVRRRLDALRGTGHDVEELDVDAAVLIGDEFPGANLCHFMLDQASRLALYRRAGVDVEAATVIGPALRTEFQRVVSERMGVRSYLSTLRRARVRVGRLWVSSNCRRLLHPAHWGAEWAVRAVRSVFDRDPPRFNSPDLVQQRPPRRLLVSREDSPSRRIANADEVRAELALFDFKDIVPGLLPFADQVAAFRDATHVVAPHGQALANILFCAPGTHVLETFHPLYGTWAYAMIAPTLGLHYASLVGRDGTSDMPADNDPALPRDGRNTHSGRDMRVDKSELRRWLKDVGLTPGAPC